jgi:hypothetical protein
VPVLSVLQRVATTCHEQPYFSAASTCHLVTFLWLCVALSCSDSIFIR